MITPKIPWPTSRYVTPTKIQTQKFSDIFESNLEGFLLLWSFFNEKEVKFWWSLSPEDFGALPQWNNYFYKFTQQTAKIQDHASKTFHATLLTQRNYIFHIVNFEDNSGMFRNAVK